MGKAGGEGSAALSCQFVTGLASPHLLANFTTSSAGLHGKRRQ